MERRSPLTVVQEVPETTVVVVNQNLDTIAKQQIQLEQEFGALIQARLALVTEVQNIKNNIRINHFKARFGAVVSGPVDENLGGHIHICIQTW